VRDIATRTSVLLQNEREALPLDAGTQGSPL